MFTCDMLMHSKTCSSKIFLGGTTMTNLSSDVLNAMVDDSYEAWKSILQCNPKIIQLLNYLEQCNHLSKRLKEIRLGLEHDLTLEQIKIYARPEFDFSQMKPIRLGLEAGFTTENINRYARSEFNGQQMMEICSGYVYGLSEEQISRYANPSLDAEQMSNIRWSYIAKLTKEQLQAYNDLLAKKFFVKQDKINKLKGIIESSN